MANDNNKTFCEQVSKLLIEQLKSGTAPWQKNLDFGDFPSNPITGKRYKGINAIYLLAQDYTDQRWMTSRQAEEADAYVMSGAKSTQIQYWKFTEERSKIDSKGQTILDADGQPIKEQVKLEQPCMFLANVFNVTQFDNLLSFVPENCWVDGHKRVNNILQASGVIIHHNEPNQASHQRNSHDIYLPGDPTQIEFTKENIDKYVDSCYKYYTTALRELSYWTIRHEYPDLNYPIGSEGDAKEKLRVEIASMVLAAELGVEYNPSQQNAYNHMWIKILEDDPYEIFRAARDAEKIREYLISFEQELTQEQILAQHSEREVSHNYSVQQSPAVDQRNDRIYMNVSYDQKDEAKALGAKWDLEKKLWYISADTNSPSFDKWEKITDINQFQSITQKSAQDRQYLAVPYEEHQVAKAAGALWDKVVKCWYAGPQADIAKLERWKPENVAAYQELAMSPEQEFMETMQSIGCIIEDYPIMDGQDHRVQVVGDKNNQSSGSYRGYLDGHPAGSVTNFRTSETITWSSKGYTFDVAQQAVHQAEMAAKSTERAKQKAQEREQVAQYVSEQTANLEPIIEPTPYLEAKQIKPQAGVFTDQGGQKTYVPAIDENGKQWTMQYITYDGTKRFAKGGRKHGCFHAVGGITELEKAPTIVISEGYATAVSIAEALGHSTVAAFDAGNLEYVAKVLHEKYPDRPIIIAGDDDRHLEFKQGTNPGKERALAAAEAVGGKAIFPIFARQETVYPKNLPPITPENYWQHVSATKALENTDKELNSNQFTVQQEVELKHAQLSSEQLAALSTIEEYTDFNDLATKSLIGVDGLKRQIQSAIDQVISNTQEHQRLHVEHQPPQVQKQTRSHAAHL